MKTKALKRQQAVERQARYDALTPAEKEARLLSRRGASEREYKRMKAAR